MIKKLTLILTFSYLSSLSFAGNFNSAATGNWHVNTSWTLTSGTDADGVPDIDDNVTILSGHTITISSTGPTGGSNVNDLTLDFGGTLTMQKTINYYGNYINNGTEIAPAFVNTYYRGVGKTISGSGTFANYALLNFAPSSSTTIAFGTTINKPNPTTTNFHASSSVTNNGTFQFWNTNLFGTGQVFTNGPTGVLKIGYKNFMLARTFNASAVGNTVRIEYSSNLLPTPVGGVFHHLIVVSPNASLAETTTVNGDFTVLNTGGCIANNFDIDVNGNVAINGVWTPSTGRSFTLSGSAAQAISTTAVSTRNFTNLVIDNPLTVTLTNGTYQVTQSLTILQGTLDANNRTFTLFSDASQTAVIGSCGSTAAVTNGSDIRLQRFISARGAGYSDMSGSVVGETLADWDNELLLVYAYSPPDFYPSVFGYDETAFDYIPITSSTQTLDPGVGFEVYLDSDGGQTTFNATTVDNRGIPFIGDLDMSGYLTFNNDGWNLIGNPYHANLDFDLLGNSTLDIAGDMLVYDEVTADFVIVSGGMGELFAPNQGFWVNVTGPSPFLQFTEGLKSTSNSSNFRHKKTSMFTLRLKSVDQTRYTSGTSFRFSTTPETTGKWGSLPFKKVPHPDAPAFCSKSTEGKDLKINLLNSTENTISVPLKFTVGLSGIYTIEQQNIETANAEGFNCITLYDNVLNKAIDIANENYQFYAEKGEAENRFTLVMSKNGDCKKAETIVTNSNEVDINRIGDNTLVKLNFENETGVSITINDLLGQNITPSQVLVASVQDIYVPIPAGFYGIYLVTVSYNNKTITRKLYK